MDELVNRFENFDMNDNSRNSIDNQNLVTKFLTEIDNDYQSDIVLKLFCGYAGYSCGYDEIEESERAKN
jgi:hypothetical protein